MRFLTLILPTLAGFALAAETNPAASASSAVSSAISSIVSSMSSEATKTEAKTTATEAKSTDATSTGGAVAIGAGEAGGVVVAALGVVALML